MKGPPIISRLGFVVRNYKRKVVPHQLHSTWSFLSNVENPLLAQSSTGKRTRMFSWIRDQILKTSSTGGLKPLVQNSVIMNDASPIIDLNAIKPVHVLEATRLVQVDNQQRLRKIVSFIHNEMNMRDTTTCISNSDLLGIYHKIVNQGILSIHVTTSNLQNIIALFSLTCTNQYSSMNYLNEASQVLTNWMDHPDQSSVIYEALYWLKSHMETAIQQIDAMEGSLVQQHDSEKQHLKKALRIIQQLLLTGPRMVFNGNNNQIYTFENLNHIQELRHHLKDINSQFLQYTIKPRPWSNNEREALLDLMCNILGVQQSLAQSMGFTSYAEMNLIQSSPMVTRMGGISAIQKLHQEIVCKLNQQHDIHHRSKDLYMEKVTTVNLHTVLEVLFQLCEDLFHLKCEIVRTGSPERRSWIDSDINVFEIHICDKNSSHNNQNILGSIILDPLQRRGKIHGEFLIPIINKKFLSQDHVNGDKLPLVTFISLNITDELKERNTIFMTIDDAQALFHEFGHALECILRMTTMEDVFLLQTEQDGSEIISQFMEYWLYDVRVLSKIVTMSNDTAKKEIVKIMNRIQETRKSKKLDELFHRILISELELRIHLSCGKTSLTDKCKVEKENILISIKEMFLSKTSFDQVEDDIEFFIHVFENNAKGKNTLQHRYLWSEITSADSFRAFPNESMVQHKLGELGNRFRRHLFERKKLLDEGINDEKYDMLTAVRLFQGRDASSDAFMNYILPPKKRWKDLRRRNKK